MSSICRRRFVYEVKEKATSTGKVRTKWKLQCHFARGCHLGFQELSMYHVFFISGNKLTRTSHISYLVVYRCQMSTLKYNHICQEKIHVGGAWK